MSASVGAELDGPCGRAVEVLHADPANPDQTATVASWFLICPSQSPAWDCYQLSVVHLRDVEGQSRPAVISREGATHEVLLLALDPARSPVPQDPSTWSGLRPYNFVGQYTVPDDEHARSDLRLLALAVIHGQTWAEPPLSGSLEPWRTLLDELEAHHRGDHNQTDAGDGAALDPRHPSTLTLIRGVDVVEGHAHPRWSDGAPILVSDDVFADLTAAYGQTWRKVRCFVTQVSSDEVTVMPYSDDDVDPIEVSPSDLRRAL